MAGDTILSETKGGVALLRINRPEARNALTLAMIAAIADALESFDVNPGIGATVIAGAGDIFAAGADVKEMQALSFPDIYVRDLYAAMERIGRCRKPLIAAVAGLALGGGCELALAADIVIAADTARFGQPEVGLGIIPGYGATQRLIRSVGKAKAMDMILTGRIIDAAEAERIGLVSRVVPAADLITAAMAVGDVLAGRSQPVVMMAKEAIGVALETGLGEGLRAERRLFQSVFATADQKEGLAAFIEKRPPRFNNR